MELGQKVKDEAKDLNKIGQKIMRSDNIMERLLEVKRRNDHFNKGIKL